MDKWWQQTPPTNHPSLKTTTRDNLTRRKFFLPCSYFMILGSSKIGQGIVNICSPSFEGLMVCQMMYTSAYPQNGLMPVAILRLPSMETNYDKGFQQSNFKSFIVLPFCLCHYHGNKIQGDDTSVKICKAWNILIYWGQKAGRVTGHKGKKWSGDDRV